MFLRSLLAILCSYFWCYKSEISMYISRDNVIDQFYITETLLSAQGDEAKAGELAQSGLDVK